MGTPTPKRIRNDLSNNDQAKPGIENSVDQFSFAFKTELSMRNYGRLHMHFCNNYQSSITEGQRQILGSHAFCSNLRRFFQGTLEQQFKLIASRHEMPVIIPTKTKHFASLKSKP